MDLNGCETNNYNFRLLELVPVFPAVFLFFLLGGDRFMEVDPVQ